MISRSLLLFVKSRFSIKLLFLQLLEVVERYIFLSNKKLPHPYLLQLEKNQIAVFVLTLIFSSYL